MISLRFLGFKTLKTPYTFWFDLKKIDLGKKEGVKRLILIKNETYSEQISKQFAEAESFAFNRIVNQEFPK